MTAPQTPRTVILVGATGMVGRAVMARAVGRESIRLHAIARREVPLPAGARMEMLLADPANWPEAIAASGAGSDLAASADCIVIALGTTIAAVGGDKTAFRAVDHDLVLACARAAKQAGIRQAIVVSSVGAKAGARNFYLSVKGETEDALARLHFNRLDVLRPGLLRGHREGPLRAGERVGMIASPLLDMALHGKARRYRSIRASTIADAALALVGARPDGRFVHEHDQLRRAALKIGS
ncbi:NAD(P)H-binding protein [Novosphingobium sp.]|uniref:NAD(P)H-binding protein n=1 Tax=Novosphingobium sp. TaxID=1874826 RepID=UPI0025DC3E5A|nr:NAD(P)H-binding protein [Novosphingobium sp.]